MAEKIVYGSKDSKKKFQKIDDDWEEDDRFSKGKNTIQFYVEEIPETCKECPLFVKNINRDNIEDPAFYCIFRSSLASGQFAGTDITDPKYYKCPLKLLEEADIIVEMQESLADHDARITHCETLIKYYHQTP